MSRKYSDIDRDGAEILGEVFRRGESSGWAGSLEERDELARALRPYNVVYTDDMAGTWERQRPTTEREDGDS